MTSVSRETLVVDLFFDLTDVWFADLFSTVQFPWELLRPKVKEAWIDQRIKANLEQVPREGSFVLKTTHVRVGQGNATIEAGSYLSGNQIEVQEGVLVEAGAWVAGPTILGPNTTIRHGAYVRGGVITGRGSVIGHASEVKSSIFLNDVKAPHFAYVGDSILGNRVNLGAGTKVSNLKITNDEIRIPLGGEDRMATGLRKMGGVIGDHCETGCNSVLNPGVLLGKKCMIYPAVSVRSGFYPENTWVRA